MFQVYATQRLGLRLMEKIRNVSYKDWQRLFKRKIPSVSHLKKFYWKKEKNAWCKWFISAFTRKWDPVPGPHRTPKNPSNLWDTLEPWEPLLTPRIFLRPPVFLGMWCVKSILGIISSLYLKPQFFNYKTLSILNRLFLGNNLLEIFNSLLKPIKYNLIHIFKIDFGINSKKSNFFSMLWGFV